jgi:prepilin-type N-terminal cleavage/methylation domain-containing protein
MKKINKKAFTLIELSIVILIIGVLVAGVTQSSRLIQKFKLNTAQTLTSSSPVNGIKGLIGWWETTSDKSFDNAEESDSTSISNWYDINPQTISSSANNMVQSTSGLKPSYKESCINSLPCVNFSNADSAMATEQNLNYPITGFTVFIVANINNSAALSTDSLLSSGNWYVSTNLGGVHYNIDEQSYNRQSSGFAGISKVYTISDDGTATNIYVNGTANVNSSSGTYVSSKTLTTLAMGPSNVSDFYIGEAIIFDRYLLTEERQSVEKYLGKKWGMNF